MAVAHAKAIVVILNFESAASFGTWCCGPCKLQDAVGKAYLGSIYYAISCFTYSYYFNLLFNVVEIVGPEVLSCTPMVLLTRIFRDRINFKSYP